MERRCGKPEQPPQLCVPLHRAEQLEQLTLTLRQAKLARAAAARTAAWRVAGRDQQLAQ